MRAGLSTFPINKPFERLETHAPIAELVLRLVVDFYSDAPVVVGSATILCRHLLLTAGHVLKSKPLLERSDVGKSGLGERSVRVDRGLVAIQILPDGEIVIWDVVSAIAHPSSDLALLQTSSDPRRSHPDWPRRLGTPRVNPFAPQVGERVAAFGYRRGHALASRNVAGGMHIDVDDEFISSVGVVREVHEWRRDRVMLSFPCYQVGARFDVGMSGGPVFDEYGSLCGIVCTNVDGSHRPGEPISFVTTLWPLFTLIIDFDRGDSYDRGVRYPAIELARDGQVQVADRSRLFNWFSVHIDPGVASQ